MSIKRGMLLIMSMYSLAFMAIPALLPLFSESPGPLGMPIWIAPTSLFVFAAAWAKLWEDFGAADERHRQKEPSHDQ